MTPQEYVHRITVLVRSGQDEAALALAARHSRQLLPYLGAEQLLRVGDMLESAALAAEVTDAVRSIPTGTTAMASPTRAAAPPADPQVVANST